MGQTYLGYYCTLRRTGIMSYNSVNSAFLHVFRPLNRYFFLSYACKLKMARYLQLFLCLNSDPTLELSFGFVGTIKC